MANNTYTLDAVVIDKTIDVVLDNIQSQDIEVNNEVVAGGGSSRLVDRILVVMSQKPVLKFNCANLLTLFSNIGFDGLSIDGTTVTGLKQFLKKRKTGGVGFESSGHLSVTAKWGYIIVSEVNLAQGEIAAAALECHVISADGTSPFTFATGATLPSSADGVDEVFTLGKVDAGGTVLDNVESVTISFGLNVVAKMADGLLWPVRVSIDKQNPIITVKTSNLDQARTFAASTMLGTQSDTDLIVYMRRKETYPGVGDIADGETEHASFKMSKWQAQVPNLPVSTDEDGTADIIFKALWETGVSPLVIATGHVIP